MDKTPIVDRTPAGLYILLILCGLALVVGYTQSSQEWLLLVLIPVVLIAGGIHLLRGAAIRRRKRAILFAALDRQARALLHAAPESARLPELIELQVEQLFPKCEFLAWLSGGEVLFQNRQRTTYPFAEMEAALAADSAGYCYWRTPDSRRALLAAIGNMGRGGVCIIPPANEHPVKHLPAARAVADQLDGALQVSDRFALALAQQAQSYEDAIYSQAYRAELLTQTLALQRMEQELAVAWRIQASFLPEETPEIAGWQVSTTLEPAREMSGDFYDIIPLADNRLGIVVADVADKGLGPALFMALCRTLIRTYAREADNRPDTVLATANQRILEDTRSDLFVTVFYGVLDTRTGMLDYCNAGHNPPLLFCCDREDGEPPDARPLTRTALPLGILPSLEGWTEKTVIAPGDVLVLYTDGVTEAQDERQEFYTEERLYRLVRRNQHRSAPIIAAKIVDSVYEFMGDAGQQDDITLVVVSRDPQEP
jgi:serine phosphatase RsbU (regulator of sigma subunit)